ncbi:MAG TPA: hypothetical protein VH370_00150 [Humisphaera sp.]|jgi:hypothetical protein|nr:hypothetical protein [Humisphaera sp.]
MRPRQKRKEQWGKLHENRREKPPWAAKAAARQASYNSSSSVAPGSEKLTQNNGDEVGERNIAVGGK